MESHTDSSSWAVQQLAGLLAAITGYDDEQRMLDGALHRVAEAVDAELCVVVRPDGTTPVAIGFPAHDIPGPMLRQIVAGTRATATVEGLGEVPVDVVSVPGDGGHLLIGRSSEPLTASDTHLIGSMLQVVELALKLRRAADLERELRRRSEDQARELRHANDTLRELSATKDTLISVASHELRTPLTSILGFTSTLQQHHDRIAGHERTEYLRVIHRQGVRLLRLIDDLLTVGRLESGESVPQPALVPVLRSAQQALAPLSVEIPVCGDADATAWVDPGHLEQMVVNLATNATKYGRAPFELTVTAADGCTALTMIDHGQGVPESFLPRLFDAFAQASTGETRDSTGTGLGLAIVAGLVRENGGTVSYERDQDVSRFIVRLPSQRP